MNSLTQKRCTKCGKVKLAGEFGKDKRLISGIKSWCKRCRLDIAKIWRDANREKINKKLRDWYTNHPGKNYEYHKKYIAKEGKDLLLKTSGRKWKLENKEKVREISRNRHARIKKAGGKITAAEWRGVLKKYGNKCLRCGRDDVKLTMDHVKPIFIGGTHTVDTVQPLCLSCNSTKTRNI